MIRFKRPETQYLGLVDASEDGMAGIKKSLSATLRCALFWCTAATILCTAQSVRAAETNEWLGGDTTSSYSWFDWFVPANWTLNRVPTTADVVVVRAGIVEASRESRFARLELYSADIVGELLVDTEMDWNGGTVLGSLTITSNGVIRVKDVPLSKVLYNATVFNHGKVFVNWHEWYWHSEVVWHNEPGSVFEVGPLSGPLILSYPGIATMRNAGTIRVNSTGEVPWRAIMENSGTLEVQSGTLELWEGLVNSGTIAVQSNAVLALAGGTFDLCSGTRTGRAQIRGDIAVANGRLCGEIDLISGTLEGYLEIVPDAVVDVRSLGQQLFPHLADGATVTNRGTVIIHDQEWYWGNGVVWHTDPEGRVVTFWRGVNSSLSALKPIFVNEGEFVAPLGSPDMNVQFINKGAASLGSGEARFLPGYTQWSGTTWMSNLWFRGNMTLEGGTLFATGGFYDNVTNRGRLEIDTRVGGLMVRGVYVQGSTGELAATVRLPASATVLEIDEDSHVDGRLSLVITNSIPSPGEIVTVFSTRRRTGEFAQVSGLGIGNGLRWEKTYEPWGLYLTTAQSPQRLTLRSLTEGVLEFDGDAERALEFQASTDLITWETLLSTNTPTGMIRLIDPDRANYAHRFYRVFYP